VLVERCAGIDIGRNEVVACVRGPGPGGRGRRKQTRTFSSFTGELEAMADWFTAEGVTEVAMEATGSYWKPVWYVLEERAFALRLVNAHHVKILPGRKSDVLDAEWLAELLEHGLLRGSFVPPPAIRELRDLTRYRKRLIQTHTSEYQRIQKALEDAGIKLDSVASEVLGVSGRAMLAALVAGERDPEVLAELAKGVLRKKIPALRQAAECVLAEIGADMSRFPDAGHLASWAGLAPGNNITGGKRGSGKTTNGDPWLADILTQCAWAAARTRDTYLSAQFWRLARRIGKKKAAVAVGRSILVVCWHLLAADSDYTDLGGDYFTRRANPDRRRDRLIEQLTGLGYRVTLDKVA
jgi:transposase